jgi:hypothetical protein
MALSKSRLIGTGLAVAATAGVAALAYAAIGAGRTLPRLAAEQGHVIAAADASPDRVAQARDRKDAAPAAKDAAPTTSQGAPAARKDGTTADKPAAGPESRAEIRHGPAKDSDVRVTAPNTEVDVDKDRGKVRVRAPYTKVDVDPDKGQVRVRAPYVNLDIRW